MNNNRTIPIISTTSALPINNRQRFIPAVKTVDANREIQNAVIIAELQKQMQEMKRHFTATLSTTKRSYGPDPDLQVSKALNIYFKLFLY